MNSSSDFPATPGVELGPREEGEPIEDWPYREAMGSLIWLSTMTRPDISNAARAVACHSHNPTDKHWTEALGSSSEHNGIPSWDQGYGIDFCEGLGIGFDYV